MNKLAVTFAAGSTLFAACLLTSPASALPAANLTAASADASTVQTVAWCGYYRCYGGYYGGYYPGYYGAYAPVVVVPAPYIYGPVYRPWIGPRFYGAGWYGPRRLGWRLRRW